MSARRKTAFAAAVALLVGVPPFLPPYPLTLVTQILIVAVFAMSLDLLLGYTGLASLGHAAYFGVAAYVVAIRATGVYFLMITLALGMVVWGLAFRWVSLTMGDNGISGIARPSIGGLSLAGPLAFHYLSLAAFLVAFALLWLVVRSPFGLSLQGIRETERRMRALG
ncbi:MAG: branched-chain amino acid ABC transporter permease, partial [Myxococcales bacterium]